MSAFFNPGVRFRRMNLFYAVTSAHCSGMFIVFGSPLAAIRGH